MEGKYETLTYGTAAPSSSRREDHVASPGEWRDWAALPRDVLYVVLSKLPQTEILGAAELVCSPWRRLALEEHLLWRRIDLRLWDEKERHPEGWKAMALAALERSAGRCESFKGHVDADVLVHLANRQILLLPSRCIDLNYK
jgi:hypothetical protein